MLALALALAQRPQRGRGDDARRDAGERSISSHTEALDALVAEGGPLAGMAAYDAAHLRALSPPEGDDAGPTCATSLRAFARPSRSSPTRSRRSGAAQRAADIARS